ncbi:hypothetical protein [Curvivirga sp.]|uniref:hypothetical protein n=1 Tax=Curvivirga sp. TaxID=2856848 RepID=UPI003B5A5F1B
MKTILVKLSVFCTLLFAVTACQTASFLKDEPLTLNFNAAQHFEEFLERKDTSLFFVDDYGAYSVYYYCRETRCTATLKNTAAYECQRDAGSECGLLATKHSIQWKNTGNFMPYKSEIVYQTYGSYFYDE